MVARLAAPSGGATTMAGGTQSMKRTTPRARRMDLARHSRPTERAAAFTRMAHAATGAIVLAIGDRRSESAIDASKTDGAHAHAVDARAVC